MGQRDRPHADQVLLRLLRSELGGLELPLQVELACRRRPVRLVDHLVGHLLHAQQRLVSLLQLGARLLQGILQLEPRGRPLRGQSSLPVLLLLLLLLPRQLLFLWVRGRRVLLGRPQNRLRLLHRQRPLLPVLHALFQLAS